MSEGLHTEIIGLAKADDNGKFSFDRLAAGKLKNKFKQLLTQPDFADSVAGFIRAVGAFQAGGQTAAAQQLMSIGTDVLDELGQAAAAPKEKLKAVMTGATDLSTLRPVGAEPAPKGAVKATAFIRPLPKQR